MSWFWSSSSSSAEPAVGWFSSWWSAPAADTPAKPPPPSEEDLASAKSRLRPVVTYPLSHPPRVFPEQLVASRKKILSGRARRANPPFPISSEQLQSGAARLRSVVTYAPGRNAPNGGVDIRVTLKKTTPYMISVTPAIIAAAKAAMRHATTNAVRPRASETPISAEFKDFVASPRLRHTVTRVSRGCVVGRVVGE